MSILNSKEQAAQEFLSRTEEALGKPLLSQIQSNVFCVAGCGAVGSMMAEMLVRSGANTIFLIDGDCVELSNLNRTFAFMPSDVGKKKVDVLKARLEQIPPYPINITAHPQHLHADISSGEILYDKGGELLRSSTVVLLGIDYNASRKLCSDACRANNIKCITIGIGIDEHGDGDYECAYSPVIPDCKLDEEGYGHGSYASFVLEAAGAGFGMLLSHLSDSKSSYKHLHRKIKNHAPSCSCFSL